MLERFSAGRRNLALAVLGVLALWFAWTIRAVLNPLLLGYLFAFILHPAVVWVEGKGVSRRVAVNLTFVAGFLFAALISMVLVLQVRALAVDALRGRAPAPEAGVETGVETGVEAPKVTAAERLQLRLDDFTDSVNERFGTDLRFVVPDLGSAGELAREFLAEHEDSVEAAAGAGLQVAGRGLSFLSRLVGRLISIAGLFLLVPIYTYYLLFELGRINAFVRRYFPKRDRDRIADVVERIGQVVANFFRGRLLVCFLKGALLSAGLWVAGIEYAVLFGMVSGFLSLIPFFGPFLGFLGAFLVGMIGEHTFVSSLVRTGIVFGVCEVIEGYVLIPKVLGDSLGLHPVVVLFALLAGGAAMGMLGILIALPLTASLVIVVEEFVLPALRDAVDTT